MAEIEMDVDVVPPPNFDNHVDEDLIDYDIDTTDEHNQALWATVKEEQMPDNTVMDLHDDTIIGVDTNMAEFVNDADGTQDHSDSFHEEEIGDEDDSAVVVPNGDLLSSGEDITVDGTHYKHEHTAGDGADEAASEPQEQADEINYEEDELPAAQESHSVQENTTKTIDNGASNSSSAVEEESADIATEQITLLPQISENDATVSQEQAAETYEDEVSWERVEPEQPFANSHEDARTQHAGETTTNEFILSQESKEPTSEIIGVESENPDSIDHAGHYHHDQDGVDFDEDETVVALFEDEDQVTTQQQEQSSGVDSLVQEFPVITVQYKGDEFPLISQTASEGFFTSSSILDDNMESLLAGLRAELANEIAAEEEIVFQVDELGLEFVETSPNETLSGITLRQILEIFDLLVKNQDPDNSRTLYTYLFTKPNTSRRYELLVESAAAGKGLNDVIHLFQNPPQQNGGLAVVHKDDDRTDESADSYVSVADAEDAAREHENKGHEQHDEEEEEEEAGDKHQQQSELSGDAEYHDQISETGADNHAQQIEKVSEADSAEDGYEAEVQISSVGDMAQSHQHIPGEELHSLQVNTDANDNSDNELNQLPQSEFVESVNVDEDNATYEQFHNTDFEGGNIHETASDNEDANQSATHTSTTNTLVNGDDIPTMADTDGIPDDEDESAQEGIVRDELQEIDWRDEPEDNAVTTPSGASKRPRLEDEQSRDDEQDLKRRRP